MSILEISCQQSTRLTSRQLSAATSPGFRYYQGTRWCAAADAFTPDVVLCIRGRFRQLGLRSLLENAVVPGAVGRPGHCGAVNSSEGAVPNCTGIPSM